MRKVTKKWTMRDGTKIRICDMENSHILNTIDMLKRMHQKSLLEAYSFASSLQGDMASFCAEREIAAMEEVESDHPLFEGLCDEARRRKII